MTEENQNPSGEDDLPLTAQNSVGECFLGIGHVATSIHSIKVELNKMDAEKITMTLDCDRTNWRIDEEDYADYLKYFNFFGDANTLIFIPCFKGSS